MRLHNLGKSDDDIDERVIEKEIVKNVKDFIIRFGTDFIFIGNQYRIEVAGEEMFIDLLFFNRELNCLVAVELKSGKFKPSYLGQLNTYLSVLDDVMPTAGVSFLEAFLQWFVLFSYLLPLSLMCTIEACRLFLMFIISYDRHMIEEDRGKLRI